MSEPDVRREQTADGVLVLTLNRPDTMNAINGGINAALVKAARDSKVDDSIRAIVITGNGRGFCSGADLSAGGPARGDFEGGGDGASARGRSSRVNKFGPGELIAALADADVPIIGAINGAAAGAGFGLSLTCDVRIASENARMGPIFIKRGVGPDYATSFWLPRIVGLARAFDIMYRGDLMDAQTALSLGLVAKVVPHENLMDEAMAYASMVAKGPPLAYTYTRRALQRSLDNDLRRHLEYEWENQTELLETRDAGEGFRAFLERREPSFEGQ
ncbi:MAG TPA: enoyl-CoA hydratase-related protein [Dehalococcoidia bacterium]|jgi:2-(1,2-epoxy-1,2-dihydrophenyl)acetyl-CoA isomerase